jgi:Fe-S cluster biogenesis protein NfuA
MKVAAVYAILNHQYKRGSGDGWEYCEYIGITKDLQFVLDTYTKRLSVESVAYVKALSFSYPQKSVMEEIASSWRALAVQYNGPVSINTALDAWIVVPESGVASQVPDSSSNPSTVPEGKDQRTQQIVEFIRATQYNDDDEDDEEDEEDEANQVQEVVSNIMNNAQTPTQGSNIVSPFMNDSLGTAQVLTEEKTIKQPLIFNAVNVEKVLDEVRPYLISDGGNVSVQKVDTDKNDIYLLLEGACGSCSSSTVTMQLGIERTLRENFPDLGQVIQVGQEMSNADSKADYLTTEAVNTELNRISPAVTAMGAVCEIVSVDPIGVVELR